MSPCEVPALVAPKEPCVLIASHGIMYMLDDMFDMLAALRSFFKIDLLS